MADFLPGIASVFITGLGQVLKGQFWRGIKIFLTAVGLGMLQVGTPLLLPRQIGTLAALGLLGFGGVFYLAQVADAIDVIDLGAFVPYLSRK